MHKFSFDSGIKSLTEFTQIFNYFSSIFLVLFLEVSVIPHVVCWWIVWGFPHIYLLYLCLILELNIMMPLMIIPPLNLFLPIHIMVALSKWPRTLDNCVKIWLNDILNQHRRTALWAIWITVTAGKKKNPTGTVSIGI